MPAHTQRAHFEPAWTGDSFAGVRRVSHMPKGADHLRCQDVNLQWAWTDPRKKRLGGVAFALHWANPRQNNFQYLVVGKHVRRMTARELRRPIGRWTAAQVRRWRRGPDKASARPAPYAALVRFAVRVGVTIVGELKSLAFATAIAAQHVVQAAKRAKHPPWFMALWKSMPGCKQKCRAIVRAGGFFAVILGRFQRYRRALRVALRTWAVKPSRVW